FPAEPSGEQRESGAGVQPLEDAVLCDPALAQDQAVGAVSMEEALKVVDHFIIVRRDALIVNHGCRESPVVIPSAAVFPDLNFFGGDAAGCEMLYGALDCLAVGFAHVYQYAVHVEDQNPIRRHRISRSSSRKRRVCSRVPTVTRTQPGIS